MFVARPNVPWHFPEEFINAYRLHPMLPDLIEYRELGSDANVILRGKATRAMRQHGPANWALSLGRQRLGKLTLQNHPSFLQSLSMPRLKSGSGKIDVAALDLIIANAAYRAIMNIAVSTGSSS